MAARLATVAPPVAGVYHLGRRSDDPFTPPAWEYALDDGTFGNRFDDPGAGGNASPIERFRMVYCATQRAAAFGETDARFRPSFSLLAALEEVDDDEPVAASLEGVVDPDDRRRGIIPADWRIHRHIGQTILDPALQFVDISPAESMQWLRQTLAPLAAQFGIADIDLSSLTSQQRQLTQACARRIYELVDSDGHPQFAGIRYLSRLNRAWECWAVFDDRIRHGPGYPSSPESIFPDDRVLVQVASLFSLTIESLEGRYLRP